MDNYWFYIFSTIQVVGFFSSLNAVLKAKTSEAAIAWFISLNLLPLITLPFYWLFGRYKIDGYVEARRRDNNVLYQKLKGPMGEYGKKLFNSPRVGVLAKLSMMPISENNHVKLISDGDKKLDELLRAIKSAKNYILIEYYIFECDQMGLLIAKTLADMSNQGVKVYILVDQLGTSLDRKVINLWAQSKVEWSYFKSAKGLKRFYQLNFRNHRKVVIVDGKQAFIGGMNIGNEYLTSNNSWSDLHIKITGPSVLALQVVFLEDWYWIYHSILDLNWSKQELAENDPLCSVVIVPSGPSDELDTARLMILELSLRATKRLWLTTPYFVPTSDIIQALILAHLKGVDVRLLVPKKSDNYTVKYASQYYLNILYKAGVKVMEFEGGFYHGKSILVDDDLSCIGSVNLDNRSMFLNFEISAIMKSHEFAQTLSARLEQDFSLSKPYNGKKNGIFHRLLVHLARLLSPVL